MFYFYLAYFNENYSFVETMMNISLDDSHWRMTQNMTENQNQASCFTDYNVFPGQSNFYLESNQQFDQWQQQQQLQFNLQVPNLGQLNNQLFFNQYQRPVELTTTISRKSRSTVSEAVKRQRQLRRNERERERQARLNSAFDVLRGSIPSFLAPYKEEQKLTQIETLRLAKYYIRSLKGMLEEYEEEDEAKDDDVTELRSKKPRTESFTGSEASSC